MKPQDQTALDVAVRDEKSHECWACIHLMTGADNLRRCRVDTNALPVSPALEADCKRYLLKAGSDDVPEWYRDAWHVAGDD